jgi:hypothetical protein
MARLDAVGEKQSLRPVFRVPLVAGDDLRIGGEPGPLIEETPFGVARLFTHRHRIGRRLGNQAPAPASTHSFMLAAREFARSLGKQQIHSVRSDVDGDHVAVPHDSPRPGLPGFRAWMGRGQTPHGAGKASSVSSATRSSKPGPFRSQTEP